MMKYNFSGHPVVGFPLAPFIGVNFPKEGSALIEQIRQVILRLENREKLMEGVIPEIILPGYSQAAAILLAEWHGQYGCFPKIRWAVREKLEQKMGLLIPIRRPRI